MKKFIALFTLLALLMPLGNEAWAQKTKSKNKKNTKKTEATQRVKTGARAEEKSDLDTSDWYNFQDDKSRTTGGLQQQDSMLRANSDTLMKHIRILSSSQYEGRIAGSQAYIDAANYCASVLSSYGIKPYDGEWAQYFEVEYNEIENCNFYTYVNDNDTRIRYVLGRDYVCSSMTGRGYTDAPVVFCGWGIDDRYYNEYSQVDVQGKVVLCLSGVPDFLPASVTDRYATLRDKAEVARRHGAAGLVCINLSETCLPYEVQHQAYCGEAAYQLTFPVVQPTQQMGDALLQNEQMTLDSAIATLKATQTPHSFHLRKRFEININAKYKDNASTCNVVGVLPGYDEKLKGEILVVGAHLDHVGMQGSTCLFPGADDNASGVAAVLECARLLTTHAPADIEYNKRTIVFVLFSGGEYQHLGSRIFVSNFPKLKKIEAFINAECIGAGDSILVEGNRRFPLLWEVANHNDAVYPQMLCHSQVTNPKGDASAFAAVGIPSMVFTHYQGNHHNHVPSDISENIERDIMTKNASLMAQVIYELSLGDYQGRSLRSKRFSFDR